LPPSSEILARNRGHVACTLQEWSLVVKTPTLLALLSLLAPACSGRTVAGGTGGTTGAFDTCEKNSDCVVRPQSCCGQCGAATRTDIVAINQAQASAYQAHACPDGAACPACYMQQDGALIATCESKKCKVVDVTEHASSACKTSSDCRFRTNVCCECGGPTTPDHIISINVSSDASYGSLVCDPGQACAECAPIYQLDAQPVCTLNEHCVVGWLVH
jgi:hypothetical protein